MQGKQKLKLKLCLIMLIWTLSTVGPTEMKCNWFNDNWINWNFMRCWAVFCLLLHASCVSCRTARNFLWFTLNFILLCAVGSWAGRLHATSSWWCVFATCHFSVVPLRSWYMTRVITRFILFWNAEICGNLNKWGSFFNMTRILSNDLFKIKLCWRKTWF